MLVLNDHSPRLAIIHYAQQLFGGKSVIKANGYESGLGHSEKEFGVFMPVLGEQPHPVALFQPQAK
jgi:hypothetical protein